MTFKKSVSPAPRTFYVSIAGDNTQDGVSIDTPFLTIQAAIDAVNALSPPPTVLNPSAILINGSGQFFETGLSIPEGCQFDAPNIFILPTGGNVFFPGSFANFQLVVTGLLVDTGTVFNIAGQTVLAIDIGDCSINGDGSIAFHITGASDDFEVSVSRLALVDDNCIGILDETTSDGAPDIYNINEITLDGLNTVGIRYNPSLSTSEAVLRAGAITEVTGFTGTLAIEVLNATLNAEVTLINADTAIHVASGGTLNIFSDEVTGDIIVDAGGTLNCTIGLHTGTITRNGTINGQINDGGLTNFYGGFRVVKNPGNQVNIDVPPVVTPYDLILPPANGILGQSLELDASLELQWVTPLPTPGGSDTEIQYNNAGVLDGIPLITTDGFNLDFGNATQARFGAGNDLTIQHTSTEVQIRNNTGRFSIINSSGEDFELAGGGGDQIFKLGTIDNTTALRIQNGIGTDLFIVTADGVTSFTAGTTLSLADNVSALWGTAALNIFHNGTDTTILNDTSGGQLKIQQAAAASLLIQNSNTTNDIINKLGTTTNATRFSIHDSSDAEIFNVLGDGQTIIGASSGDASALLDLTSTTRGFLVPRMTTVQRDAISSPATGLEIYNTTTSEPEFFNGVIWQNTGATAPGGSTSEIQYNNNGVFAGASFITTDGQDLSFADFGFANFGDDSDLTIRHNGTTSFIRNNTGDLIIESFVVDKNIIIALGSTTNATEFDVQDSVLTSLLKVQGDGNVGINTSAPDSKLTIVEEIHLPILGSWGTQTSAVDNTWDDVAFGNNTFVAISTDGTDRVMRSVDNGVSWTSISTPLDGIALAGIAFGNNTFVVVAPGDNNIMTSIDNGLNWVKKTSPSNNGWEAVTFGNGLFVMVVGVGAEPKSAFSSDNGATWTLGQTSGSGGLENNLWNDITFGNGTFVACSNDGTNRVAHSVDGALWTSAVTTLTSPNSITFGNGVFVMVDDSGPSDTIARSTDKGASWSTVVPPTLNNWRSVAFGSGTFIAVSTNGSGDRSISSIDGGLTWQTLTTPVDNIWRGVAFGNDNFVAVSGTGTSNRVMTIPVTLAEFTASILDLQSTTSGFLPPQLSTTQRDVIPSPIAGLELFNTTSKLPNFYNGDLWKGLAPASNEVVYVNALSDLPTPVASVITLAGGTTYKILDDVDIGSNQLLIVDGGTVIQGFNVSQTTLSGTTTVPLIQANNFPNIRDIIIQQKGSGEVFNTVAGLFSFNVLWFGGDMRLISGGVAIFIGGTIQLGARVIQDAAGGVADLVILSGFTLRDNAGAIDGLIEFETGSTTTNFRYPGNGIFLTNASVGIKINQGATINNFAFDSNALGITNASSIMIEVENPDDVLLGSIDNATFTGPGTPLRCDPISSSNFAAPALTPTDVAFDGDGNLIISTGGTIFRMVGITNVVDTSIVARGSNTTAITWLKGDLYSGDNILDNVGRHSGFSTTILSTTATPAANISGLTDDGINLISSDNVTGTIYIHNGIDTTLAAVLDSFVPTSITTLHGVARNGINILAADKSDGTIHVLKGDSAVTQYNFDIPGGATNVDGLVVTDTGFIFCDELSSTIFLYDHPVTFDHSAATWSITDTLGIVLSSDRGGSSFQDSTQRTITISTVNIFVDVADSGTDIFYGSFSVMEKCRLNNETTGEVIWTGAREKGRIVSGAITLTRGGATTDIFYEIAVCINGIPQKDSITALVLPNSTQISTIQTIPITRDLISTDVVKLQLRNTTNTQDPDIFASKISIN